MRLRFLFVALLISTAASLTTARDPAPEWRSEHYRDHPLVGRIWDVRSAAFASEAQVFDRLASSRHVLLGERHDNPDHHALQARAVTEIVARGRRPLLAMEMLDEGRTAALTDYLEQHPADAAGLGAALDWEATGWPAWEDYQPIVQAALDAGLPIRTANLQRSLIGKIAREGMAALPDEQRELLALPDPLPEPLASLHTKAVTDGHCGLMPEEMAPAMVRVQAVRDAVMARAMLAGSDDGSILIAGTGHARRDAGVPWHLHRFGAPPDAIVSVAFTEVEPDAMEAISYAERHGVETPPFDFLWFTPKADISDPCEGLREQFKSGGTNG